LRYILGAMLLATALVLSACGGGGEQPSGSTAATEAPAPQAAATDTPAAVTGTGTTTDTGTTGGTGAVTETGSMSETGTTTDTGGAGGTGTMTETGTTTETGTMTETGGITETGEMTETGTATETGTMSETGSTGGEEAPALEAGTFLTDQEGRTLYLFLKDTQGVGDTPAVTTCYDQCAERWPPLLVEDEAMLDQSLGDIEGLDTEMLGTIERTDGTMQVTYNGWPLYYWYEDVAPGDTLGQGVGDVWYVVTPEGEAIDSD
jgi:predicted lipoprotein with Yx(FWY)xxD motif